MAQRAALAEGPVGGDDDALLDAIIDGGNMLCGTPDEVAEQIAAWGEVGMDQLVFGMPVEGMHQEEVLQCLELFGDKVIPQFDPDRTHSTDRYRATAKPKYPKFNHPLPGRRRVADGHPGERARPAVARPAPDPSCRATPPPPRNGCSAKRSGCSRGGVSTR